MVDFWRGKNAIYFGDSIMAQDGKVYSYPADFNRDQLGGVCRGWPTLLNDRLGLVNAGNYAIGGHNVRNQRDVILETDISEADLIVIAVGVNDFSSGTPIGRLPESTVRSHDETFMGRYCAALDSIFQRKPLVRVLLMTPLHRNTLHRTGNVPINTIDSRIAGQTLGDFAEAIRQIGAFYACPVADLYAEAGLNRFNLPLMTYEGVHPTDAGYEFTLPPILRALT